jgi:hypothetical protein
LKRQESDGTKMKSKPKLISIAEATKALQWLEEFQHGDSSDAAQARVVCGLIRRLERAACVRSCPLVAAKEEKLTPEALKTKLEKICLIS